MEDKTRLLIFASLTAIIFSSSMIIWAYLLTGVFAEMSLSGYLIIIILTSSISAITSLILFDSMRKLTDNYKEKKGNLMIKKFNEEIEKQKNKKLYLISKGEMVKMKIKSGKVYYKITIEKTDLTQLELINFIRAKCKDRIIGEIESNKVKSLDFDMNPLPVSLMFEGIKLDINIKPRDREVILLFHTQMTTDQFNEFTYEWFK